MLSLLCFLPSSFATPIPVIDQQNTSFDSFLGPSTAAGQSFTPTGSSIDFATFNLAVGSSADVYLTLFAGDGFGGTVLGTSSTVDVTSSNFAATTFDFSGLALTPGQIYTLQLDDAAGTLFELESSGNAYTRGTEYDSSGIAQNGYDMAFSEGYNSNPPSVTPEPNSLVLLGTGMASVAALWRKRRGRATV